METTLDNIISFIKEKQTSIFNFKTWWEQTIKNFEEICFLGEIDQNNLYVAMLHQILLENNEIQTLTIEQANEFYLTGNIIDNFNTSITNLNFKPFSWTFWRINLETNFLSSFISFNANPNKSPKENFSESFSQVKIYPSQCMFYEAPFDCLMEKDRKVFKKLVKIVQYSKYFEITINDFNKKIKNNTMTYFGIPNNKNFVEQEYVDSNAPERINLPQKYIPVRMGKEIDSLMRGPNYDEKTFTSPNALIKTFDSYKDVHNYMYSLIDYINKNNLTYDSTQQIDHIEKYWSSYDWPFPEDKSTILENRKNYTKYEIAITKFKDNIYFKADVHEFGVMYYYTN